MQILAVEIEKNKETATHILKIKNFSGQFKLKALIIIAVIVSFLFFLFFFFYFFFN